MNRLLLNNIMVSQKEAIQGQRITELIERTESLEQYLEEPEITIITGVRRSGKSTTLEALLLRKDFFKNTIYINFEDPRLNEFKAINFQDIFEIWYADNQNTEKRIAIFDEVQNIEGWEPWMNFFSKQKGFKVYVTGSNSKMLSKELGTHLTGRIRNITNFPLSFQEIVNNELKLKKIPKVPSKQLTLEQSMPLVKLTERYMKYGGFPRAWQMQSTSILTEYFQNIIERDIIRRKKIKSYLTFEKFSITVMTEIGRLINKSRIAQLCGLKDPDTAEKYLRYLEESFLGFQIRKYDSSIRKQLRNQPKFYAIDGALAAQVSPPSDSRDSYLLENLVLVELLRRGSKVYYWRDGESGEIDFLVETPNRERQLIQVCWTMDEDSTLKRELNAFSKFKEAYPRLKVDQRIIITMRQEFPKLPKDIITMPFYLWVYDFKQVDY